ncbi:MAG: hypothetical protein WD294_15745 [Phycisphaeraceae bacterium]
MHHESKGRQFRVVVSALTLVAVLAVGCERERPEYGDEPVDAPPPPPPQSESGEPGEAGGEVVFSLDEMEQELGGSGGGITEAGGDVTQAAREAARAAGETIEDGGRRLREAAAD